MFAAKIWRGFEPTEEQKSGFLAPFKPCDRAPGGKFHQHVNPSWSGVDTVP